MIGRVGARCRQRIPVVKGKHGREIKTRMVMRGHQRFQPHAPFKEGQGAQIVTAKAQHIIDAQMCRVAGEQLFRDRLAVEPLLQRVEGLHPPIDQHQQFAVERGIIGQGLDKIGEGAGDVLAGARIKPPGDRAILAGARGRLNADAIPFPFGAKLRRIELLEITILDRVRQHGRRKGSRVVVFRPLACALRPGKERGIGRFQTVPNLFNIVGLQIAEARNGSFGKPRRHADP
jgi:hypothetical protein